MGPEEYWQHAALGHLYQQDRALPGELDAERGPFVIVTATTAYLVPGQGWRQEIQAWKEYGARTVKVLPAEVTLSTSAARDWSAVARQEVDFAAAQRGDAGGERTRVVVALTDA